MELPRDTPKRNEIEFSVEDLNENHVKLRRWTRYVGVVREMRNVSFRFSWKWRQIIIAVCKTLFWLYNLTWKYATSLQYYLYCSNNCCICTLWLKICTHYSHNYELYSHNYSRILAAIMLLSWDSKPRHCCSFQKFFLLWNAVHQNIHVTKLIKFSQTNIFTLHSQSIYSLRLVH